jgi:hypothetical protein
LLTGEWGGGVAGVAESYDGEKAWSSGNYSILFGASDIYPSSGSPPLLTLGIYEEKSQVPENKNCKNIPGGNWIRAFRILAMCSL